MRDQPLAEKPEYQQWCLDILKIESSAPEAHPPWAGNPTLSAGWKKEIFIQ